MLENKAVLDHLAELKAEFGLMIGLTTTGTNQVEVIRRALEVELDGLAIFDTFQTTFNILDQSLAELAEVLHEQNKRMIIKEAMANGRIFPNAAYPHYKAMYNTLREMAQRYNVGIDAIALRFCADILQPYTVLSGAANKRQIEENLLANQFTLAEQDLETLQSFKAAPQEYWAERKKLSWN